MATTTMTMFKPNTDDFGQLTMHATFLGEQALGSNRQRQDRLNILIVLAFLITLIVGGIGLYQLDQAAFNHTHTQVASRALLVDYD